MLNEKLYRETFDKLRASPETRRKIMRMAEQKRAPRRALRTALIAAAVAAALCVTAGAAYQYYVRQNVPVDQDQTVQGIAGAGQPSWDAERTYDEFGKTEHNWYNRQTVPADPDQALALLGDYLPESGYQWQIEDFTLTVEGYVLDEHTGTAKFYYTVEHPGGFPEDAVDWEHGYLNYTANILYVAVHPMSEEFYFGGRTYVDVDRSTPEKLCLVNSGATSDVGWKAEDGVRICFSIPGEEHQEDVGDQHIIIRDAHRAEGELELPGVKSLPARTAADAATGRTVELSAIGMTAYLGESEMNHRIEIEYADGTRYLVEDGSNNIDNGDYGLLIGGAPDWSVRKVFNRLVDVDQVTAVTVDGVRYTVG